MLEIKELIPEAAAGLFLLLGSIGDIRKKAVSVRLIRMMYGVSIILFFWQRLEGWKESLIGAGIGAVLLLMADLTGEKIGRGDGYIIGSLGILLGFRECLRICAIALLAAALFSVVLLLLRKGSWKTAFPFLPFLLAGFVAVELKGTCF